MACRENIAGPLGQKSLLRASTMASEPPHITLSAEDGTEVPKRTIKFQCGLLRETETFMGEDVEILCRETLLDYICDMLTVKVGPVQ